MKLVAARCPNCGANIDVDANSDSTKCEFCNTKILVDDAINKLRVEISGEVEVKNLPKKIDLIKNANRYYDNHEYDEAYKCYNKVLELDPDNYVALFRNGICKSLEFSYKNFNLKPLENGMNEALKVLNQSYSKVNKEQFNANYNQIVSESFNAITTLENNIHKEYVKGLDYDGLQENSKYLLECAKLYDKYSI